MENLAKRLGDRLHLEREKAVEELREELLPDGGAVITETLRDSRRINRENELHLNARIPLRRAFSRSGGTA
jgi:hypothetical protein